MPSAKGLRTVKMQQRNTRPAADKQSIVILAHIIRIAPERDGDAWVVLTPNGNGWLHGPRESAITDQRWLAAQWRGRQR
jgi:hypothetical protein